MDFGFVFALAKKNDLEVVHCLRTQEKDRLDSTFLRQA